MKEYPENTKAERAIVSSVLRNGSQDILSSGTLKPQAFSDPRASTVWAACTELYLSKSPISSITVIAHLSANGNLGMAGGPGFVLSFAADEEEYTPDQNNAHASLVVEAFKQRSAIELLRSAQGDIQSGDPIGKAAGKLAALSRLGPSVTSCEQGVDMVCCAVKSSIERDGRLIGIPSGIETLDRMSYGFCKGALYIMGGAPGAGKSSLLLTFANHIAVRLRIPTLFFSLEMSAASVFTRLLCARAGVDVASIGRGRSTNSDLSAIQREREVMAGAMLFVDDEPALTIDLIRARSRAFVAKYPNSIIMVDYIQLVESDIGDRATREREVAVVSRGLKVMSINLDVPVVALAQLKRRDETRPPEMSDLRESGSLEQTASIVGILWRRPPDSEEHEIGPRDSFLPVELHVTKNRDGVTGMVPLLFNRQSTSFSDEPF